MPVTGLCPSLGLAVGRGSHRVPALRRPLLARGAAGIPLLSHEGGNGRATHWGFQRGMRAGTPGFHALVWFCSFAGIARAETSLGDAVGRAVGGVRWRRWGDFTSRLHARAEDEDLHVFQQLPGSRPLVPALFLPLW